MIQLGERIRELRARDGRTQDALASELGVTAQAVSRWEKGTCYPDMEMIPSIANYFGVSIDELFGYDNERSKKVDALAGRIDEMNRQNSGKDVDMDACIALAREALIEFPGSEKLTLALASALFNAGYVRRGEYHVRDEDGFGVYDTRRHREYPEWREAVRLYEKLLPSLQSGALRQRAVTELSQLYKNMGEHEKALALAEAAPDIIASKPLLRVNAFDGKAAVAACGEALLEFARQIAELSVQIVLNDGAIPAKTAAEQLARAESVLACVCPDHDYGKDHGLLAGLQLLRSYYLWLAGDRDAAFAALEQASGHAERLDALRSSAGGYHSSPLLHYVPIRAEPTRDASFRAELPEVWPWWDVPERERVRAEMRSDPRWAAWVRKTGEEL